MDVRRKGWSWEEKGLGGRGCASVHSTKLEQHSKHTVRHRIMDIHHEKSTETTDLEEVMRRIFNEQTTLFEFNFRLVLF